MKTYTLHSAVPLSAVWAIHEPTARRLMATLEAMPPAPAEPAEPKPYEMVNGTAIIPITGVMLKRPGMCMGFDQTTIWTRQLVRQAANDEDVTSVLLVIDSPGGECNGTEDLSADVAMLSALKPTIAYADGIMASAAYWVGSQCNQVIGSSTCMVGSIGTLMVIDDSSKAAEKAGVKVHVISTGDFKGMGADGAPISDEQLAEMQRNVDALNTHFKAGVARGRNMSPEDLDAIADGRCWIGQEAVDMGLLDSIATVDAVLQALSEAHQPLARRSALPPSTRAQADSALDGPTEETPMSFLSKAKAFFTGNPEMSAKAGITDDELATTPVEPATEEPDAPVTPATPAVDEEVDSKVEAIIRQNQALSATLIQQQAKAFATTLKESGKIVPAQEDEIVALYTDAAIKDGGVQADGTVASGANVKRVESIFAKAISHKLSDQEIPNPNPQEQGGLVQQGSEAAKATLRNTPLGRQAAAKKKEGN